MSPLRALLTAAAAALLASGAAAANVDPFPTPASKKGLQVQMVDDALALGVKHAALNCMLGSWPSLEARPHDPRWTLGGREYAFRAEAVSALDRQVKPLTDAGAVVYLILLANVSGDPARDALIAHPRYDPAAPNKLSAFNATDPEAAGWLRAMIEFIADRYSRSEAEHGRVWGYIVGNEVNSHWWWYNLGRASAEEVASEYERAVRLVHEAVRKSSANARVYVSLEHHWQMRFPVGDEKQALPGRTLIDAFARIARERGDFDWHVAHHPYPEDLMNPRTWLDKSAPAAEDAPRITFKNLETLQRYLGRPELLHEDKPRRIILSEQGFNALQTPQGERLQAAAYCYAWWKAANLPGVDAFILHRHVDHAHEGELRVGLWTRKEGTLSAPERKRLMYEVFRQADTPQWDDVSAFALPIIGVKSWNDVLAPAR